MKNYLKLLLFTCVLTTGMGCKDKQSEATKTETAQTATASENTIAVDGVKLKTYQDFLNTLDTANISSSSKAGEEFKKLFASADTETSDSAYCLFRDFHQRMVIPRQNIIDENNESYLGFFGETPVSKKAKDYRDMLQKNGFDLNQTEGYVYTEVSYKFQKKYVFDRLSPAMQSYFIQTQKEITEGTASDGGLIVEPKVLAERVVFWEEFLKKYPNFRWNIEATSSTGWFTDMLLNGLDNTPAFDYETKMLNVSYQQAYRFLMDNKAETQAKKILAEYYPILSQNKMKDSPQAQAYRAKLSNTSQ